MYPYLSGSSVRCRYGRHLFYNDVVWIEALRDSIKLQLYCAELRMTLEELRGMNTGKRC